MEGKNPELDQSAGEAGNDGTKTPMVTVTSDALESERPIIPFSLWWPFLAGALAGLFLRLIYSGAPYGLSSAMNGAFLYLAPIAVGAITVYVAETKERRSWGYYIWAPMLSVAIFVIGTLVIMIEGMICAILIIPFFSVFGAVGGLIMGVVCRITHWPKQTAYCMVLLPIVMGALPQSEQGNQHVGSSERTITIHAHPEEIWQQIHNARNIQPEEVNRGWMYRIGVPLPLAGVTEQTPEGLVRKITMGKAVHFEQVVTDWQEDRFVRWTYRFSEDSFPAGALDDHVRIGGQYFDMIDTSYLLTPIDADRTTLTIHMSYRVNTQFNWYANSIAQLLIGNFEEVILDFYRSRAT